MMRTRKVGLLGAAALGVVLVACGDSPAGPPVEDPGTGTGTGTLGVTATITALDVSGGFVTNFTVSVRDANQNPVSGASVTVENDVLGTLTLLELNTGSGEYQASVNTFASGDYRLSVIRGPDRVEGVSVPGLSAHAILSPVPNATVVADQPMTVAWDPASAMAATVQTRDFMVGDLADSGSYTIAAENNPERASQRVRVWRSNRVEIAGGLEGSELSLVVRRTVEPVIVE